MVCELVMFSNMIVEIVFMLVWLLDSTSAQIVETSFTTTNNSRSRDYNKPVDVTKRSTFICHLNSSKASGHYIGTVLIEPVKNCKFL